MDIVSDLGYLASASRFRRISERLYHDGDKIYQKHSVKFKATWFSVFYALAKSHKPLTILEIAGQIDFSHVAVKNVLRELEAENLILVQPNPEDKRSKIVYLSDGGKVLLDELKPVWEEFTIQLKRTFESGHRDILNILDRIDTEISTRPIHDHAIKESSEEVRVFDYSLGCKGKFSEIAKPWLLGVLDGKLEEEDILSLDRPDEAYLLNGGFIFFASYKGEIAGCVALKRLDEHSFEFAKLFILPNFRKLGIATKLIERCITRCKENYIPELWLQTTNSMPQAHKLYYKLGFKDEPAPPQMDVLDRTEKIMVLNL